MRKHLGLAVGLSLLFLAPAFGDERDLSADPLWKALGIVPQCNLAARPPRGPSGGGAGTDATCTASCGTSSVSCTTSGTGTCTAVDRNCSVGEPGHVTCGSTTTYCPTACPCSATALCGSTTVSCTNSGTGTCTAVDQSCAVSQQGYVTCGSTTISCPTTCPVENCDQYNTPRCTYSWDSSRGCCVAGPTCPDACLN